MTREASTAVSSESGAKLRDWACVAGRGRLLLSGSVAHASLKTAVQMSVQGSAKVGAPGLVNFITAVAHHFCLQPSLQLA